MYTVNFLRSVLRRFILPRIFFHFHIFFSLSPFWFFVMSISLNWMLLFMKRFFFIFFSNCCENRLTASWWNFLLHDVFLWIISCFANTLLLNRTWFSISQINLLSRMNMNGARKSVADHRNVFSVSKLFKFDNFVHRFSLWASHQWRFLFCLYK